MTTPADDPAEAEQAQNEHLARRLAEASPTVAAMWAEHLETFEKTLITLLLGEIGDWYTASVVEETNNREERDRVTNALAEAFQAGTDYLQNVIATGFVESLPGPQSADRSVVEQLPGPLRAELASMEKAAQEGR